MHVEGRRRWRARASPSPAALDARSIPRIESSAGESGPGDTEENRKCASASSRANGREAQRSTALGARGRGCAFVSNVSRERGALARRIGELSAIPSTGSIPTDAFEVVDSLLGALEAGELRAAERDDAGIWRAVPWVKQGILLAFRIGEVIDITAYVTEGAPARFFYFDKHTVPPRGFDLTDGVRVVPGGSSIRRGAYVAKGVVCMPPMYINVGAHVGANTMVDSHALVGSCAQIGE